MSGWARRRAWLPPRKDDHLAGQRTTLGQLSAQIPHCSTLFTHVQHIAVTAPIGGSARAYLVGLSRRRRFYRHGVHRKTAGVTCILIQAALT